MSIGEAYQQCLYRLKQIYDHREAATITDLVIENITGFRASDRVLNKNFLLTAEQQNSLTSYQIDLLKHKPVQYVLNEAWFAGMKFYVDKNVLIPRPETEELVEWIKESFQEAIISVLDIGTGSGCIAISLKKKIDDAKITAVDISENALAIAKQNAEFNNAEIKFFLLDILNENNWKNLGKFDVIVSNPPYIKQSEKFGMSKNVLSYEPHQALFVADDDALLFYKKIAAFGLYHFNKKGKLFFEINEQHGKNVCDLLEEVGYKNIELKKDLQGKDRMIKAVYCL